LKDKFPKINVSILKRTEKPVSQGKYTPNPPIESAVYPSIIRLLTL